MKLPIKKIDRKNDRYKIYNKYDGHCAYCGSEIKYKEMQVDHIIPQANFFNWMRNFEANGFHYGIPEFLKHLTYLDLNHWDNLNPSCRKCNKHKDTFPLETFRKEIELQVERLNSTSTQYQRAKRYGLVQETKNEVVFYFEKLWQKE